MIEIVSKTIQYYFKNMTEPSIGDIEIKDTQLLEKKGKVFVILYKNGEIRGSSGNIQEISESLAQEIITNTIQALSKDTRFSPVSLDEQKDIKIRVDYISERKPLQDQEYKKLDPVKSGILAIHKNYDSMAVILPNINPKLITGEDFAYILEEKLKSHPFKESDYILYEIKTHSETNY